MKSLAKVFVALLLAVTLALGGVQGNANAQTVGANFEVAIDVNKTIDQILSLVTYNQKFVIQVANQTTQNLTRVGAYNNSSNWPVVDVGSMKTVGQQFAGNSVGGSFSFAANYAIGNTGRFAQFSASWPYIGYRKIQIGVVNETGNGPARKAWDNMNDADDKNAMNGPFSIRGVMAQRNDSIIWFYNLR